MKDLDVRDLPRERPQGVAENDFIVKLRDDDPYGFWWIGRAKGQVPHSLTGAYTTADKATAAVANYIAALEKKK